jgi:polysaccharide export outer membrane protein
VNLRASSLVLMASLVSVSALGCHHPPKFDYASELDPRKQPYVLGPSDTLKVTVWKQVDLSGETTVRPDGTITLPLIGDIHAAGRTPAQVRAEIAQRLATFIKDEAAVVTVAVTAINSYRFTIGGNVERPGNFSANHFVTVTEALSLAGGPNRFATPEEIVVIRSNDERGTRRIPIDYTAILTGKRPDSDIVILAGDTIYVP